MYLTAIILNTKVMLIKQNVKTFSIKEHLKEITPHLKNLILYPKRSDEWKIQLTMLLYLSMLIVPYKDNNDNFVMHPKNYGW